MDINKYRVFSEVAHYGSFTTAATVLNYTQSNISQTICSMEKEFGFSLFYRSKHGVELTEKGKHVYELCGDLISAENQLMQAVTQMNQNVTGVLRIGSYHSIATEYLPKSIKILLDRFPLVSPVITCYDPDGELEMFKEQRLDIGIGKYDEIMPANCEFIPLFFDPAVVVFPRGHDLARFKVVSSKELLKYPLITQQNRSNTELKLLYGEQMLGLTSKCSVRYDRCIIGLVREGVGIAVTSKSLLNVTDDIEFRPVSPLRGRKIGLIVPQSRQPSKAVVEYVNIMKDLFQEESFRDCAHTLSK